MRLKELRSCRSDRDDCKDNTSEDNVGWATAAFKAKKPIAAAAADAPGDMAGRGAAATAGTPAFGMDFKRGGAGGAVLGITFTGGEEGLTSGRGLVLGICLTVSWVAALLAFRFSTLLRLAAGRGMLFAGRGTTGLAGFEVEVRALPKRLFIVAFLLGDKGYCYLELSKYIKSMITENSVKMP